MSYFKLQVNTAADDSHEYGEKIFRGKEGGGNPFLLYYEPLWSHMNICDLLIQFWYCCT